MVMTVIKLSEEQAELLSNATDPIAFCHPDGSAIAYVSTKRLIKEPLFTPEEIAEAERRIDSPGPWYTTQEVLAHLRSLG
jgi:hypothetical protein